MAPPDSTRKAKGLEVDRTILFIKNDSSLEISRTLKSNPLSVFRQLTIIGPGLLGASICLAAKERALVERVVAWSRRKETRDKCLAAGISDSIAESAAASVEGSDLVIICTPVETILPILREIAGNLPPDAIVTDVGSTKSLICREARGILSDRDFVGSHPMAGSEQTGLENARTDLFEGASCFVTPMEESPPATIARLSDFWSGLGMTVEQVSPEKHDEIVAHISHLPHLLSSSLCAYLSKNEPGWAAYAGGGLRDTTRIASGDPTLWHQILGQNRDEVLRAIDGFERVLHELKAALSNEDQARVRTILQSAKSFRDGMPPSR